MNTGLKMLPSASRPFQIHRSSSSLSTRSRGETGEGARTRATGETSSRSSSTHQLKNVAEDRYSRSADLMREHRVRHHVDVDADDHAAGNTRAGRVREDTIPHRDLSLGRRSLAEVRPV